MPGGGELAHIDAQLSDEDLGGPLVDAGYGVEPGEKRRCRIKSARSRHQPRTPSEGAGTHVGDFVGTMRVARHIPAGHTTR